MQTILGPFHPHLEDAFVEEILRFKSDDPLCPLITLVPSDSLRRRLKTLLTRERGLTFVNLQILTFHQLSLRLFAEANGPLAPVLHDDLFLEEALRQVIRTREPDTAAFAGIEERAGGCAALWQTLRDLRDGLVDPAVAGEALREGHFAQRTTQRTSDLLELFQTLLRFCSEKSIKTPADLDKSAAEQAPQSPFLKQLRHIFYYGFYDLTQIQIEFFDAVAQHYPTTLLFPLIASRPPHHGWSFAERFYQRYVQGRGGRDIARNLTDEPARTRTLPVTFAVFDQDTQRTFRSLPIRWHCTIFNAFGMHDEVGAVAKEILRLVDEGTAVDEIGVVARSLDSYGATIKEIFARHQIPVAAAIEEPLVQFPLTKAAILLLNLPAKDYLRSDVIELLSSPYFRPGDPHGKDGDFRPDLWDLATRELAICKGIREWQRLERYAAKDLVLSQVSSDDDPRAIKISAAQLRALHMILEGLASDLTRFPPVTSWSQYAALWKDLLERYLGIAKDAADDTDTETTIGTQIATILEQMAGLDAVNAVVSLSEFSRTFEHWLERSTLVASPQNIRGVAVINATAARGLKFRALFIVGMNEGVFPRTIREDAFLRDRDREVLEQDLGYKISQKFAAFDEEKLLFTLLVNAARERLYCSFQRSDESGRVLAPSWYLADLKRALGAGHAKQTKEVTIPRSITDKARYQPFSDDNLLLPEELAIRLSLAGEEAVSLVEAANLSPGLYKPGIQTIERLDLSSQRLHEFDGMITAFDEYRRRLSENGLSPTALELYGRCPFQYFARRVMGLQRLETPEEVVGPSLAEFGELGHLIMKLTYQELIRRGYFTGHRPTTDVDSALTIAARQAFAEYEANNPIGYPLTWETLRDTLTQLIREVLQRDLQQLAETGYVPVEFEVDITDPLPANWPEPLNGLKIHGRMDRIDLDFSANRMRVVDYKFKFGAKQPAEDNDLNRAALRGERLQPPLYSLLAKHRTEKEYETGPAREVEASFFYIAPRWSNGPLVTQSFSAGELSGKLGTEIQKTVSYLAEGIKSGRFFMQRGEHCQYCEVAEICRKNHPPSLWRAENDPIAHAHRRLHDKDPKDL
ncbi:MAG TPA: PD-(D/E)XK nuclease family protein [Candidatus Binatia bacterium]